MYLIIRQLFGSVFKVKTLAIESHSLLSTAMQKSSENSFPNIKLTTVTAVKALDIVV